MRFLLVALFGILPSCAFGPPAFKVTVDALAAQNGGGERAYFLVPGNEDVTWDDLQFQEYAGYLDRALQTKGFAPAERSEDADVAIVLSYGVSGPTTKQQSYSRPIWGQTGYRAVFIPSRNSRGVDGVACAGTTIYTPTYGVTGYASGIRSVTTYLQHVMVVAYEPKDLAESERPVELWRVTMSNVGVSSDLRRGFPVMLAASLPYFASNSGQRIELKLYEDDAAVQMLKGAAE